MTNKFLLLLLLSFIFRVLISTAIYSGDLNNHVGWGRSIIKYGFSGAYSRSYTGIMQPTYPPIALYAFTTSVGLYQWINGIIINLNKSVDIFPSQLVWYMEDQNVEPAFTKAIAILSDLGVGTLIYMFTRRLSKNKILALITSGLYLFNPAVWYVSALWGQIESVPIFFILLSIYLLKKNFYFSVIAITLAVVSKQTSIIFIPFYIWIAYSKYGSIKIFKAALISIMTFWLSYLPFNSNSSILSFPFEVYINRLQTGSGSVWISDHAFNLWALFSKLAKIPDTTTLFGIPTVIVGYVLFITLFSLLFIKFTKQKYSNIFLSLATISLVAFMVLTKMHERYSSPVIPFTLLAAIKKPWLLLPFFILSIAHFLNLYHDWYFPRIHPFDQWLMNWSTIVYIITMFTVSLLVLIYASLTSKRN